jgi:hypothetical protein
MPMGCRSLFLCLRDTNMLSYRLFYFFLSRTSLQRQDIYQVCSTLRNIFTFICKKKIRNSTSGAVTGRLSRPRKNRVSNPRIGMRFDVQPCSGSQRKPMGSGDSFPVKRWGHQADHFDLSRDCGSMEPFFTPLYASMVYLETNLLCETNFPIRNNGNTYNAFRNSKSTPYLTFSL